MRLSTAPKSIHNTVLRAAASVIRDLLAEHGIGLRLDDQRPRCIISAPRRYAASAPEIRAELSALLTWESPRRGALAQRSQGIDTTACGRATLRRRPWTADSVDDSRHRSLGERDEVAIIR
jgi:hypothetical protein